MYPIQEIRRQQNVLDVAGKVLTLALLLQVPILVIFASRMTRYFWTLPGNVFWLLGGASSMLATKGGVRALGEALKAQMARRPKPAVF